MVAGLPRVTLLCASAFGAAVEVQRQRAVAHRDRTTSSQQVFGPSGCVSLRLLPATSSCELSTHCDGHDLSKVEFAFTCFLAADGGTMVRHSYGHGGFDEREQFDTGVNCDKCMLAVPAPGDNGHAARSIKPHRRSMTRPAAHARAAREAAVPRAQPVLANLGQEVRGPRDRFGPSSCISTYLGNSFTCFVETACAGVDMTGYEYAIVCVDGDGSPIRHTFGTDSFDPEETFDTEIMCKQCYGPENVPQVVQLTGHVDVIAENMANIAAKVHTLEHVVSRLTGQDFEVDAAPSPAPARAVDVDEPEDEPETASAPGPSLRGNQQSDFEEDLAPAPAPVPLLEPVDAKDDGPAFTLARNGDASEEARFAQQASDVEVDEAAADPDDE